MEEQPIESAKQHGELDTHLINGRCHYNCLVSLLKLLRF